MALMPIPPMPMKNTLCISTISKDLRYFPAILMTSFAFIAGLLPLALATGVNANANQSIGIGTAGGMLIGTFFGLFVVPVMFILMQKMQEKISGVPEAAKK